MTNLRSIGLLRTARKLAVACTFAIVIPGAAAAQTNTFPASGNAGIGTTSPNTKLEVSGSDSDQLRLSRASAPTTQYTTLGTTGADFLIQGVNTSSANHVQFRWVSQHNAATVTRMLIDQSGNVGIGTTSPTAKLHVSGSGNMQAIVESSTAAAELDLVSNATGSGKWALGTGWSSAGSIRNLWFYDNVAGATRLAIDSSGNVGIGTTTPAATLDINGSARIGNTSSGHGLLTLQTTSNDKYGYINFGPGSNYGWQIGKDINAGALGGPNGFYVYDFINSATRLAINTNGYVGIGTTSPTKKLHVAGDIQVDGNINAKYQDLAEWVPSSEQLSAGTVVVLDTTKSNQVVSAAVAYDTRVAGVISAQPGITLGEGGEGKVLVATTGRVRVKVDAARGPIQIGDLLVTSDVSGMAMKSEAVNLGGVQIHRPGTIIGKALEPLAKGSGEILVLLSLQ